MWAPKVEQTEALKAEVNHFMDCIAANRAPMNDGVAGLRVVRLLEAAEKSLQARGKLVEIDAPFSVGA
jgi:predicted dehydrogenase